ncbi:hypothetical protein DFH94DRAFT_846612 [Russula ochroleuca]|uniref:Uncharacterized protein n=1 Tax=Russula ochroleuca TaxID=152965 RepID=A0A9P5MRI0_9AGAM|nr:hypothetical protein DFH94DRAFT_846612 [Russula ochroleuca]
MTIVEWSVKMALPGGSADPLPEAICWSARYPESNNASSVKFPRQMSVHHPLVSSNKEGKLAQAGIYPSRFECEANPTSAIDGVIIALKPGQCCPVNVEDAPLGVVNGIGTRSFLPPMEFSVVPGAMTAGYGKEYVEYGYGLTRAPERRTRGRVNHHVAQDEYVAEGPGVPRSHYCDVLKSASLVKLPRDWTNLDDFYRRVLEHKGRGDFFNLLIEWDAFYSIR